MTTVRRVTVLTAVLAGTVVACGDDGDTLTTAEYRDAGNQICRDADAAVSAAIPEEEPTFEVAQTELAPQLSRALTGIREELDGLAPPSGLADDHVQLLAAFDSATAILDRATEDDAVLERILAEGPPLDEIATLASRLGLVACSGEE